MVATDKQVSYTAKATNAAFWHFFFHLNFDQSLVIETVKSLALYGDPYFISIESGFYQNMFSLVEINYALPWKACPHGDQEGL